jgi:hypothetical protein
LQVEQKEKTMKTTAQILRIGTPLPGDLVWSALPTAPVVPPKSSRTAGR